MSTQSLDILVVTDLHFHRFAHPRDVRGHRRGELADVLVRKAVRRLRQEGVEPGLILLLGDLVEDGSLPGARQDWELLNGELRRMGIPFLALPGNHDGDPGAVAQVFGCPTGLHTIAGYGFLLMSDRRVEGDMYARTEEGLRLPGRVAAANPGLPLVALQHNPLHPRIVSEYPYTLDNAEAALDSYREAGVLLSLSGHYHATQPLHDVEGVQVATAPALCDAPFGFLHVGLRSREVTCRELALQADVAGLVDVHAHTEFAYCRSDTTAAHAIALSRTLGLAGVCIVEHSFQLYFPPAEAWSFRWKGDTAMVNAAWQAPERGRMKSYRAFADGLREADVRIGLEVDLRADGSLLLASDDEQGWDILVGAVHEIHDYQHDVTTQAEAEQLFLREVYRLTEHPIDVLAHPFRFFRRKRLKVPTHLYARVAERLAQRGVAAEVNFHTNAPDAHFLRACVSQGVRIALGTDAHAQEEAGDLVPHLQVLEKAGIAPETLTEILFSPATAPATVSGVQR